MRVLSLKSVHAQASLGLSFAEQVRATVSEVLWTTLSFSTGSSVQASKLSNTERENDLNTFTILIKTGGINKV